MYEPAEDTYFLEDVIKNYRGKFALEIGIGSGYLLHCLRKNFDYVVGTDISFDSLLFAKNNSVKYDDNTYLICTDLALSIKNKFDLIISNPPYLPHGDSKIEDNTVHGGLDGFEFSLRLIKSCISLLNDAGQLLIVRSNLSNLDKMDQKIRGLFTNSKVVARKNFFFEVLDVLELSGKIYPS